MFPEVTSWNKIKTIYTVLYILTEELGLYITIPGFVKPKLFLQIINQNWKEEINAEKENEFGNLFINTICSSTYQISSCYMDQQGNLLSYWERMRNYLSTQTSNPMLIIHKYITAFRTDKTKQMTKKEITKNKQTKLRIMIKVSYILEHYLWKTRQNEWWEIFTFWTGMECAQCDKFL